MFDANEDQRKQSRTWKGNGYQERAGVGAMNSDRVRVRLDLDRYRVPAEGMGVKKNEGENKAGLGLGRYCTLASCTF